MLSDTGGKPVLEIDGLTKRYGDITALDSVGLTFSEGIHALLGPNGAGKSTLINILTRNLIPDSGTVRYGGKDISEDTVPYLALLGYVPQQQAMYRDFTVARYLGYMASLKGLPGADMDREIDEALEKVALSDRRNSRISTLSGGMRQRLLIAQALLGDPRLLILDEPTAGLDPEQRLMFKRLISDEADGKTILIATHIVSDIEYISNSIVLINKGKILRRASREELVNELEGRVFEADTDRSRFDELRDILEVIDFRRMGNDVHIRYLSDGGEILPGSCCVTASLEDVYYSYYSRGE